METPQCVTEGLPTFTLLVIDKITKLSQMKETFRNASSLEI